MARWLHGQMVPSSHWADDSGLVALGGSLDPDRLVAAYRAGVFPWSSDPVITWWSPDPRAIFDLQSFEVSRSVKKSIRRAGWRFSIDQAFERTMRACAEETSDRPGTWITDNFIASYVELHRRGLAHSVEVWRQAELVGGLYGVTLGGFFGGESMFHRDTDASKAAVAYLVEQLRGSGFALLDAQVPTPHLLSLGATEISRPDYLERLEKAVRLDVKFAKLE